MKAVLPYTTLDAALKKFRVQVSESIPYALEEFPALDSPERIFNFLKLRTRYKKDPKGRELFQSLPTLLDDNYHGITGAGDCDCFTIAALSTLLANGFTDSGIVLAGRNPFVPVHIWAYTIVNGQKKNLDLTNRAYDQTRHYPYLQSIPYKLNQEEKSMILELAEGPAGGNSQARPHPYIYFPKKGIQVREDYFDNMSAGEFQNLCLSEGVPLYEIEELSGKRAERRLANKDKKADIKIKKQAAKPRNVRRANRQDAKATRKQTGKDTRQIKQTGKADKRSATGQSRVLRGQAKVDKANNPNATDWTDKFAKVAGSAAQLIPQRQAEPEAGYGPQWGPQYETPEMPDSEQLEPVQVVYEEEEVEAEPMSETFGMPTPLFVGALLVAAGAAAYVARKRIIRGIVRRVAA